MSQLQIGLVLIGVLSVLGVIAYNKLLEKRAARKRAQVVEDSENSFLSSSRPSVAQGERTEPRLTTVVNTANSALSLTVVDRGFDEAFEQIVSLSFDQAMSGGALFEACRGVEYAGNKPIDLAATHAVSHKLELIRPDESYSGLHMGVLLANRSGALSAIEYSEFVQHVQRVAEKLDTTVDTAEMSEVLERAKTLDEQLAGIDMQVAIHVVSNSGAWLPDVVSSAAVEAGFSHRPNGQFIYYRGGAEIFHMHALDQEGRYLPILPDTSLSTVALSLNFDVPRAPEIENPFQVLISVARGIAARLGASVVDDHRRPVNDAAIDQVEKQLRPLYAQMREIGVPAGSAKALRLFA